MIIEFSQAKNNELTFSVDGKFCHSKYNPSAEAEKWIEQLSIDFNPKVIVILGAGLPYYLPKLQTKFSNAKILLIQYDKKILNKVNIEFAKSLNNIYQICISNYSTQNELTEYFFNEFTEELSNQILFLSWKPSENIFLDEYNFTLNAIQNYLSNSKDIIATRRYFSKKWIANIFRFFTLTQNNFYQIKKTKKDILVIASGPSLKNSLNKIKKYKKNLFIISVSSATKILIENKIIPDLIITTDGGYWAKKHLQFLSNEKYDIPIMCTAESSLPNNLLKNNKIIPIEYNDYTNNYFFEKTNLTTIKTNRNGTVSGTALEIAKQLTDKNIYFVGLDLSTTNGYQHSQPNILEINDSLSDNYFFNKEKRICVRNFNSSSLNTYRIWFENLPQNYTKNVTRIFTEKSKYHNLGNIKSISWDEVKFDNKIINENLFTKQNYEKKIETKKIIIDLLNKISNDIQWLTNLSLGNILNYNKYNNKLYLENAIKESKQFLEEQLLKLEKIYNDEQ